jgi:glutaredoxin
MMMKKIEVRLYTRPGCHLCEEARREMLSAGCDEEFSLEEINIDDDPALRQMYGWEIPVVTINGHKAFKYRLTAEEFRRSLRRARPINDE